MAVQRFAQDRVGTGRKGGWQRPFRFPYSRGFATIGDWRKQERLAETTSVKVAVRYMAQLRRTAGAAAEQVELTQPCSAAELLQRIAESRGGPFRNLLLDADGNVQQAVLLFVGDQQVG